MKIYNEIVIDMNPESLSYGETLHEDSFEYEGDLALLQGTWHYTYQGAEGEGDQIKVEDEYYQWNPNIGQGVYVRVEDINERSDGEELPLYDSADFTDVTSSVTTDKTLGPEGQQFAGNIPGMEGQTKGQGEGRAAVMAAIGQEYNPKYDLNNDGIVNVSDIVHGGNTGEWTQEAGDFDEGGEFGFSYDDANKFDPTSKEFQQYVGTTGGFDTLLAGFEVDKDKQKFFDPANLEKLDIYQSEYDIKSDILAEDKRAAGVTFGLAGSERLRAQKTQKLAETSANLAEERAGLQAGQKLFDIKSQADIQAARSGFAGHGGITSTVQAATGGVWQDLIGQQQALEADKAGSRLTLGAAEDKFIGAQSAWTGAQSRYGTGMRGAGLDLETSVSDFWEKEEEKFYTTLGTVEAGTASDRRLKDNITVVDKSLSGLNIYTFNYKDPGRYGHGLYQGVMSDEIPSSAVVVGKDGYDLVDYSKIDVEFKRLKEI